MITEEQKNLLDLVDDSSKLYPHKHYLNYPPMEINIYNSTRIKDVLLAIYQKGYQDGLQDGKRRKIEELKTVLEIN